MGCKGSTSENSTKKKRDQRAAEGDSSSFISKYSISALVQKGEFTQVYTCKQKKTNQELAVKVIKVDDEKQMASVKQEESVWKYLGEHKHIVALVDSITENNLHHFVMEFCQMSLEHLSRSRPERNTECGFLSTFNQVLQGLHHCHLMNVVHRDVKPANVLLDMNGTVKLCDFGISTLLPEEGLVGICGTAPYMSPEMVQLKAYGLKTDIWSCGASAYIMLYGEYPHQCADANCHQQVMGAIAKGNPKPRWEPQRGLPTPSARMRTFVQALLERNPKKRPTVEECLQLEALEAEFKIEASDDISTCSTSIGLSSQSSSYSAQTLDLQD